MAGPALIKILAPSAILLLGGCSSLLTQGAGAGAGVAGAGIANAVNANGAVTAGIGLGAQAVATAGVQYLEKTVHHREQQAIAQAAAPVPVGGIAAWHVVHSIPIENDAQGELTVVSEFAPALPTGGGPGFDCKQVIFSLDTLVKHQLHRDFYVTYVCSDSGHWAWAEAEPATARWGGLQ